MQIGNYTFLHSKNYLYSKPIKCLQVYEVGYCFAFNGKEKDNETYGEGNAYDFGERIYDTRLGRWLSLDPLQAKFPDLTPYSFVNNMPIIAIDPDGRILRIVSTNPEFVAKTFSALQKITNVQLVLFKDGTVMQAHKVSDMNKANIVQYGNPIKIPLTIKPKPIGTKLVNDIIDNKRVVSIVEQLLPRGNHTYPADWGGILKGEVVNQNGQSFTGTGTGCDAKIEFDPNDDGKDKNDGSGRKGVVNADGSKGRSPKIGLAHELGHARKFFNGLGSYILDLLKTEPDYNKKGVITFEEIGIRTNVDNPIRSEQGEKQRALPKVVPETK